MFVQQLVQPENQDNGRKNPLASVVLDTITTRFLMLFVFFLTIPVGSVILFTLSLIEPYLTTDVMDRYYGGIYIIAVASLVLAVTLAMIGARPITQPLIQLIRQVNTISRQNILDDSAQLGVRVQGFYEIKQLGNAFNRMLSRLRQEHTIRDQFVATLTHDLKVPLLAEKQTLTYMMNESYGPITDDQREVLQTLHGANASSLALVQGLLEVYRYNSGNVALKYAPLSLQQLLTEASQELSILAQEKSIHWVMDMPPLSANPGWVIVADGMEIKRTLHNLMSNALTNTPKHGKVVCRLTHPELLGKTTLNQLTEFLDSSLSAPVVLGSNIIVSIRDSGIGFSGEDLDNLFEQFSARKGRNPMSIGLGLYNAHQVVHAHHGQLWVETTEGEGSAVNFMLPVQPPLTDDGAPYERRKGNDRRQS